MCLEVAGVSPPIQTALSEWALKGVHAWYQVLYSEYTRESVL